MLMHYIAYGNFIHSFAAAFKAVSSGLSEPKTGFRPKNRTVNCLKHKKMFEKPLPTF
jgi:hypothetical protein